MSMLRPSSLTVRSASLLAPVLVSTGLALVAAPVLAQPPAHAHVQAEARATTAGPASLSQAAADVRARRVTAPMALPAKVVALYYMMWSNSGSPRLRTIPRGVNVVNLAFMQGDPPAIVDWGAQGQASFVADARALRARGVRVVASIGGEGGQVNVANRRRFIAGVMALNAKTPLDGLDWDLEGTAMGAADVVYISRRLKQLRGRGFSITMAPNGGNIDRYRSIAVQLQRAGALSMIGQQFYDAVVSKEAAQYRVAELVAAGIPQSRIAIGMMVGNQSRYWTVTESAAAVRHIKRSYPNVRGGYLWESSRPGTADWVRRVGALLRAS
jgi:hypothetical protein